MLRKKTAVYLMLISMLSSACFKSKIVATRIASNGPPATANGKTLNGVTYALPRTVVKVDVPVKLTVDTPGGLERFTPCFFSEEVSSNRITELKKSFNIEPPTFATRGEPDPDQHFIVKTKGGYFEHKSMLLEYTPDGVLTSGDAESKDESLEFAVKAATTIISIAAKTSIPALVAASPVQAKIEFQTCRAVVVAEQAIIAATAAKAAGQVAPAALPNALNAETNATAARDDATNARKALSDFRVGDPNAEAKALNAANNAIGNARNVSNDTHSAAIAAGAVPKATAATQAATRLDETLKEVAPPGLPAGQASASFTSDYDKAVDISEAIKSLQSQRESLASGATGGANIPAETLKLMLKETDTTIEAYRNTYFLGTSTEKLWSGAFEFAPPTASFPLPPPPIARTSGIFFWFSETDGLCEGPVADALGIKIPKKFKPKSGCAAVPPSALPVALRVERKSDDDGFLANLDAVHKADEIKDQQRGFYYRIPAKAAAVLQVGVAAAAKDLARDNLIVAQYGIVASLPASSSGRTTQYTIALDESTGALKNFKLGSDSLVQKSILDDVNSSANAIVDAKKAREKAKAAANDVLAQKKRELDLLKTQNEINEEKKKLENGGASGNPKP